MYCDCKISYASDVILMICSQYLVFRNSSIFLQLYRLFFSSHAYMYVCNDASIGIVISTFCSRPCLYSFLQIFQALCLFPALRLFRTLEYIPLGLLYPSNTFPFGNYLEHSTNNCISGSYCLIQKTWTNDCGLSRFFFESDVILMICSQYLVFRNSSIFLQLYRLFFSSHAYMYVCNDASIGIVISSKTVRNIA